MGRNGNGTKIKVTVAVLGEKMEELLRQNKALTERFDRHEERGDKFRADVMSCVSDNKEQLSARMDTCKEDCNTKITSLSNFRIRVDSNISLILSLVGLVSAIVAIVSSLRSHG